MSAGQHPGAEHHGPVCARVVWLTISDTRTPADDRSGQLGCDRLLRAGHTLIDYRVLPDDPERVREHVSACLDRTDCDAIVTSGGTGISPRDRTFEALDGLLEQRLDGFGELFRWLSFADVGSAAMLSRAAGGVARGKPVFFLPGSPGAVELALEALILPEMGHLIAELNKPHARPPTDVAPG